MVACQLREETLTENIDSTGLLRVGIVFATEPRNILVAKSGGRPGSTQRCSSDDQGDDMDEG
jgi:hypothetical protein